VSKRKCVDLFPSRRCGDPIIRYLGKRFHNSEIRRIEQKYVGTCTKIKKLFERHLINEIRVIWFIAIGSQHSPDVSLLTKKRFIRSMADWIHFNLLGNLQTTIFSHKNIFKDWPAFSQQRDIPF
jgi:hypothetical protein